jgi:hypothetical protein
MILEHKKPFKFLRGAKRVIHQWMALSPKGTHGAANVFIQLGPGVTKGQTRLTHQELVSMGYRDDYKIFPILVCRKTSRIFDFSKSTNCFPVPATSFLQKLFFEVGVLLWVYCCRFFFPFLLTVRPSFFKYLASRKKVFQGRFLSLLFFLFSAYFSGTYVVGCVFARDVFSSSCPGSVFFLFFCLTLKH